MTTSIIKAMELQEVKRRQYEELIKYYEEGTVNGIVNSYVAVVGYFHGEPSRVKTVTGRVLYLN